MPVANPRGRDFAGARAPRELGVFLFAKAPIPGGCKRRLGRGCNQVRAARLYRAMLERAVATASRVAPGRVTLVCSPDISHPVFLHLARRYAVARMRQTHGDLGTRMHAAARAGLRQHRGVIVLGSDQPDLAGDWFAAACDALAPNDQAWLAPTTDGGYWAIGLRHAEARIFRLVRWSTPRVAGHTRRALQRCGLETVMLAQRADIDTWRDWCALRPTLRPAIARAAAMPGLNRSKR